VGRPLAEVLYFVINGGYPFITAALLSACFSLVFLALAGSVAAQMIPGRNRLLTAAATLPLTAHPYFLENVSYQFDAPSMSAALLCSVLLVHFACARRSFIWRVSVTSLLVVAVLGLYPPALNVVIPALAVVVALRFVRGRAIEGILISIVSMSALVIGSIVFWIVVAQSVAIENARPDASQTAFDYFRVALGGYWRVIEQDWRGNGFGLLFAAVIIAGLLILARSAWSFSRRAARIAGAWTIVLVAIALQHGILLLLYYPWPNARVYTSFGAGLAFLGLVLVSRVGALDSRAGRIITAVPVVLTAYSLILVSSAIGSAAVAQQRFEMTLVGQMASDVSSILPEAGKVAIQGEAPRSVVFMNTRRKLPVVDRIVPNILSRNSIWGHSMVQYYSHFWWQVDWTPVEIPDDLEFGPPALSRPMYELFIVEDTVVVVFRS
jgi:hypothetical protein